MDKQFEIIWSPQAELDLHNILLFWLEHNKSITFPEKLYNEILETTESSSKSIHRKIYTNRRLQKNFSQVLFNRLQSRKNRNKNIKNLGRPAKGIESVKCIKTIPYFYKYYAELK